MVNVVDTVTTCNTIGMISTLGWEGDDCAKKYMQQLQTRGHIILSAHNWKIKHLKEFYPRSARLLGLNINRGDEVCLRFRAPGAKSTFLPFHEVLCTLLHEIAHCKYSSHGKYFWKLYSQLIVECEQVEIYITSGIKTIASLDSSCLTGGRRLGGGSLPLCPNSLTSRRQLLADAAQRRLRNSQQGESDGCACDAILPPGHSAVDTHWICKRCGNANLLTVTMCDFCSDISDTNNDKDGWDCVRCTFHNYGSLQFCEICNLYRLHVPQEFEFGVKYIKPLKTWTEDLSVYGLLGLLANVLDPILREKKWQMICLTEFSPLTPSTMSQGNFFDRNRFSVKVRLRSPSNTSELLPLAYVYSAVLHQLVHMIEYNHGVSFLEVWVLFLRRFLLSEKVQCTLATTCIVRESLLHFTNQLEYMLESYKSNMKSQMNLPSIYHLFADCGNTLKRERSFEGDEEMKTGGRRTVEYTQKWVCSRCSFLNHVGVFLFCEMCGTSRSFCELFSENLRGSCEESAIIVDDDDMEGVDSNKSDNIDVVML